jgi:cyclic nucleotide gated channel alpha 3
VMIVAVVLGNVVEVVTKMKANSDEFHMLVDSVKNYMELRHVDRSIEKRVTSWFDYLWANRESSALDEGAIDVLPECFRAELAFDVHADTLRRVAIFKECETGLLKQLVLKLRLAPYGPGDYVCRKGDIGREMYIIKRGKLDVVSDDGTTVFASLAAGTVFGELSILNIAGQYVVRTDVQFHWQLLE